MPDPEKPMEPDEPDDPEAEAPADDDIDPPEPFEHEIAPRIEAFKAAADRCADLVRQKSARGAAVVLDDAEGGEGQALDAAPVAAAACAADGAAPAEPDPVKPKDPGVAPPAAAPPPSSFTSSAPAFAGAAAVRAPAPVPSPSPPSPSLPVPAPHAPSLAGRATPVVAAVAASLVLVALAMRYRPSAEPVAHSLPSGLDAVASTAPVCPTSPGGWPRG